MALLCAFFTSVLAVCDGQRIIMKAYTDAKCEHVHTARTKNMQMKEEDKKYWNQCRHMTDKRSVDLKCDNNRMRNTIYKDANCKKEDVHFDFAWGKCIKVEGGSHSYYVMISLKPKPKEEKKPKETKKVQKDEKKDVKKDGKKDGKKDSKKDNNKDSKKENKKDNKKIDDKKKDTKKESKSIIASLLWG